jgi:hypothetical protein
VIEKYGETFTVPNKERPLQPLNEEEATDMAKEFIAKLSKMSVPENADSQGTHMIESSEFAGEYSILQRSVIHMIAFRKSAKGRRTKEVSSARTVAAVVPPGASELGIPHVRSVATQEPVMLRRTASSEGSTRHPVRDAAFTGIWMCAYHSRNAFYGEKHDDGSSNSPQNP